jgi:tRNA(Met) C34 N-acetyltransferase TmcA
MVGLIISHLMKSLNSECRAVVAAPSKKRAAELLEHSMYTFNAYASETGNDKDIELAMAQPETVIIREEF